MFESLCFALELAVSGTPIRNKLPLPDVIRLDDDAPGQHLSLPGFHHQGCSPLQQNRLPEGK